MRIAIINMLPYGSTGRIMLECAEIAREMGHEVRTFSALPFDRRERDLEISAPDHESFGSLGENRLHYYLGSTLGRNGFYSRRGTRALVRRLREFAPDVVHLHNLHKFCIHLPTLFGYLKKSGIPTIWTLHDCWSFTGKCPHFTLVGCDRWKTGCYRCPALAGYPRSRIDNTRAMYRKKRSLFTALDRLTLVTPSAWLADLVRESFLRDKSVRVIPNGIDLSVFHPTESDIRARLGIAEGEKLLLGVSFGWGRSKGLDVFASLAARLPDGYRILLVGADEGTAQSLPPRVMTLPRTANREELAALYTAADLFVNPTREDTFPTVNLEALACGTPVLTFRTGGSPECADDRCGSVVAVDDVDALEREIRRICEEKPYPSDACIARASQFDKTARYREYVALYEEVAGK